MDILALVAAIMLVAFVLGYRVATCQGEDRCSNCQRNRGDWPHNH